MSASASICSFPSAFGASSKVSCFIRTSRVSGRMISLSLAPRESFCTAMASSSPRNAFISAPVAVPFGAPFAPAPPRLSFTSAFAGEAFDVEAFNTDSFDVDSFSAVSAVSSAPVSAPICCSEPAANACGCHSHVFHINIADNAAAKIRFDFFLILFSSH